MFLFLKYYNFSTILYYLICRIFYYLFIC